MKQEYYDLLGELRACFDEQDAAKLASRHSFPLPFYVTHENEWIVFDKASDFVAFIPTIFNNLVGRGFSVTRVRVLDFIEDRTEIKGVTLSWAHFNPDTNLGIETQTRHFFKVVDEVPHVSMIEIIREDRPVRVALYSDPFQFDLFSAISSVHAELPLEIMAAIGGRPARDVST